ncbi:4Fe-4S dicluster domain-containing protein [Caproiciproducens sp. R1]|uniref:4Fe-4S dicluster domain-containing protein n=1 Tax=Caproiciproducens sp. R1 TaxID=3435000 RepID=UPI004033E08F
MNYKKAAEINETISWRDITPGCNIYEGGTSDTVATGEWRTMRPVLHEDKCKQCLLCVPVCPDLSIPMEKDGKRGDFNYFFCKGCGICAAVCPFGAIEMIPEEK